MAQPRHTFLTPPRWTNHCTPTSDGTPVNRETRPAHGRRASPRTRQGLTSCRPVSRLLAVRAARSPSHRPGSHRTDPLEPRPCAGWSSGGPYRIRASGMTRTQARRSDACLPGGVTRGGGVTRCGPSARPANGRAHRQVNGYRPPRGRDSMMARGPGQARTVHDSIWSMGRIRSYGIKLRTLDPRICPRASRGLATAARSPRCSPPCTTRCTARGSPPRPHPARHRTATSPPPPPSR